MVIKASAAAEIRTLIDALGRSDDVTREAAIARLAVIGPRAVQKLAAAYEPADARTRAGILRALEPVGDPRSRPVAEKALASGGEPAVAAAGVLRGLLDSSRADVATAALDRLIATALDRDASRQVRMAAFEALQSTPPDVRARVAAALASDPDAALQSAGTGRLESPTPDAVWPELEAGPLPADPTAVGAAIQYRAGSAALPALQKAIDTVRARESATASAPVRAEWKNVRGMLHQALAQRGSRIALYDLRETLERTSEPLPVSFLSALQVLGDVSCLEAIAAAHSRAAARDAWWKEQLAAAFQTICRRERITKRHAVMKRIASRFPGLAGR